MSPLLLTGDGKHFEATKARWSWTQKPCGREPPKSLRCFFRLENKTTTNNNKKQINNYDFITRSQKRSIRCYYSDFCFNPKKTDRLQRGRWGYLWQKVSFMREYTLTLEILSQIHATFWHPKNNYPKDLGPSNGLFSVAIFKECNHSWVFPKIGVPQNGWFIMENPIKMDDLGVPLLSENFHIQPASTAPSTLPVKNKIVFDRLNRLLSSYVCWGTLALLLISWVWGEPTFLA